MNRKFWKWKDQAGGGAGQREVTPDGTIADYLCNYEEYLEKIKG